MIHMRTKRDPRLWSLLLAGVFVISAECQGGIVSPLYVGNRVPVQDEFGRPMRGSPLPAEAANRCRVEIRTTTTGFVYAPGTNGAASPYNPLLTTNSVSGMGANVESADSGLFCKSFSTRPAAGTWVFARAYDAPTVAEAAFYADSQLVAVPADGSSLALVFGAIQPLDPGDADGDGLNNSWEKALGIADRATADYDGDGQADYQEMLAGTAPDDPGSRLGFAHVAPGPEGTVLGWNSVAGKSYALSRSSNLAAGVWSPVASNLAADAPLNVVTDVFAPGSGPWTWRIELE